MIGLPNLDHAIIDERKITEYLLAVGHPDGQTKAFYFRRFGFRSESWEIMRDALLDHARSAEVDQEILTDNGTRYILSGPIPTPDHRNPVIVSVWVAFANQSAPRFVTAYPGRRR